MREALHQQIGAGLGMRQHRGEFHIGIGEETLLVVLVILATHRRSHAERLLLNLIIGRRLEECVRGLTAIDVRQAISIFARARIAVTGHDYGLEGRRIPALVNDLDRSLVANGARGNRCSGARTFCFHAFDCLSAERLFHGVFMIAF